MMSALYFLDSKHKTIELGSICSTVKPEVSYGIIYSYNVGMITVSDDPY